MWRRAASDGRGRGLAGAGCLLGLAVCLLSTPPLCGQARALPPLFFHRLSEVTHLDAKPSATIDVADCDGDGQDEILELDTRGVLCKALDHGSWISVWSVTLPPGGPVLYPDLREDGRPALLLRVEPPAGEAWLEIYRVVAGSGPRLSHRLGPYLRDCRPGHEGRRGEVWPVGSGDADGDGRAELYVFAYPFVPGAEPRRLQAFDQLSGASLWSFEMAPSAGRVALCAGHGGRVLSFGSYACNNGFAVDGTDDASSYLYCLDPDGRMRWRIRTGGLHSGSHVAAGDLDGDGDEELVAVAQWGNPDPGAGRMPTVTVFEPRSGEALRSLMLPVGGTQSHLADLDGDGRPEILVRGQDDRLYCVDGEMQVRWSTAERVADELRGVEDLDGDGKPEIVCVGGDRVWVLDGGGKVVASARFADAPTAVLAEIGGRPRIVAKSGRLIRVLRLEDPAPPALTAGVGLGLAVAAGALVTQRRRALRKRNSMSAGEAQQELLEAMVAFGHGGSSLRILDRLRYWLINRERVAAPDATTTPLPALARDFAETVHNELVRLGTLARRAGVPAASWRPLPRRTQAAVEALRPLAETGEFPDGRRGTAALTELNRVEECLKGVRAHLRAVHRASPAAIARLVLERRRSELAAAGVEAALTVRCAGEPEAFAAPEILRKVLDDLVDNALRAMQEAARKDLEISVGTEGAHCQVDVRDTGAGIADADRERVFERSFTTRPGGGGFGLHYAREALARYGGRIFVTAGGPGAGTTFRIVLRLTGEGSIEGIHAGGEGRDA